MPKTLELGLEPEAAEDGKTGGRIISSSLGLMFARVSQPVLALILFTLVARFLPLADMGVYVVLMAYLFIFQAAVLLGLGPLLTRELSTDLGSGRPWVGSMAALALPASIVLWLLYYLVILAGGQSEVAVRGSLILGASLPFAAGLQLSESVFLAYGRPWGLCLPALLENVFRLALCLALLMMGYGLDALLWAYTLSRLVGFLAACIFLRKVLKGNGRLWDSQRLRTLLAGVPVFGLMFVAAMTSLRVDMVIISLTLAEEQAGLYGAAYRFVSVTFLIPDSFISVIYPVMAAKLAEVREQARELVLVAVRLLLSLEVLIVLTFIPISVWVVPWLLGEKFSASAGIIAALAFVILPHSLDGVFGFLLQADRFEKTALAIVLFGLAGNALFIYLFIHLWGVDGAAWGLIVGVGLKVAVLYFAVNRKVFRIGLAGTVAPIIVSVLAGWTVMNLVPRDAVFLRTLLAPSVCLLGLLILGTLTPSWLKRAWLVLKDAR